jgi:hypothetical protein
MENRGWEMRILIRFLYIFSMKYLFDKIDYLMRGIYSLKVVILIITFV